MKRLHAAFISLCVFLGYCSLSFAAPLERPDARAPAMDSWGEPPACMQLERYYDRLCAQQLYRIAGSLLTLKQYEQAIVRYSQILHFDEFAMVYANRGVAFMELKQRARARADFTRAVQLMPSNDGMHFNLARLDYESRRYAAALQGITHAIALNPNSPEYFALRALIRHRMHSEALARRDLDTSRELEAKEKQQAQIRDAAADPATHTTQEQNEKN